MEQIFVPMRYLCCALDKYEGEWGPLLVYTQAQSRIPPDVGSLDRLVPGRREDIVIEVESYGHHVRPTILSNRCERGSACFV
jgi:hypothetical protein